MICKGIFIGLLGLRKGGRKRMVREAGSLRMGVVSRKVSKAVRSGRTLRMLPDLGVMNDMLALALAKT